MKINLGEVCTVRSSLVDPTAGQYRDLPHIAPDSIERESGRLLGFRSAAEDGVTSAKYKFEVGDILYSKIRPSLNKVAVVDFSGLCSADMYALVVDWKRTTPRFIARLLGSQDFLRYADSLSNRANIPKLNREQLMRYEFELPSLETQRRIARILDHADLIRATRRQVLAHLSTLIQAILHDMLAGSGELVTVELAGIADIASGITKGRRTSEPARLVPYLAVMNVQAGYLKMDVVKEIEATGAEIGRYALREGDLILTEGGDPDKLGRGTIWRGELPLCLHQNHIFRVRINTDDVIPSYLEHYAASRSARLYFLRSAKQTTGIASINKTQLKALPVKLPPLRTQREFAARVERVEAQRACVQRALSADSELLASLQARAFRGEL